MERSLFKLSREGYDDSYRELFLLGNGHLGYEGSLPDEDGGFHLVGVYDQCGDKWRESLNLFDPLRLRVRFDGRDLAFSKARLSWRLDYRRAILSLRAEWKEGVYFEERFLSSSVDTLLFAKSRFRAKKTGRLSLRFQIEKDPHDINGPHYASLAASSSPLSLEGTSNEGRKAKVSLKIAGLQGLKASVSEGTPLADWEGEVKKGEIVFFERAAEALVDDERPMEGFISYEDGYWDHVSERKRRFGFFFPKADGESPFLEGLYDSAYRMSVLSDYSRIASIPARGVSGQVYKGAAFWDSEMFMLPYFLLLEPDEARSLLLYRIKTLPGALKKAERFGYQGAFYAWESQEDGVERCSLYNVTDRKTGKGIRTYFADKAIHISADIVKAFSSYYRSTGDSSLFSQGAVDVIAEVFRFYRSYASEMEDGLFHFLDVVGPEANPCLQPHAVPASGHRTVPPRMEPRLTVPVLIAERESLLSGPVEGDQRIACPERGPPPPFTGRQPDQPDKAHHLGGESSATPPRRAVPRRPRPVRPKPPRAPYRSARPTA